MFRQPMRPVTRTLALLLLRAYYFEQVPRPERARMLPKHFGSDHASSV